MPHPAIRARVRCNGMFPIVRSALSIRVPFLLRGKLVEYDGMVRSRALPDMHGRVKRHRLLAHIIHGVDGSGKGPQILAVRLFQFPEPGLGTFYQILQKRVFLDVAGDQAIEVRCEVLFDIIHRYGMDALDVPEEKRTSSTPSYGMAGAKSMGMGNLSIPQPSSERS